MADSLPRPEAADVITNLQQMGVIARSTPIPSAAYDHDDSEVLRSLAGMGMLADQALPEEGPQ